MPADFVIRPFDPVADGPALHAIFGDEESCRYLARPAMASVADTIAMMQQWIGKDDISWALAHHRRHGPRQRRLDPRLRKLGFRPEARLRGEWETHIGVRDRLIFGLMRDDPRPWRNWPS